MSTFARTAEGFVAALKTAEWMANFHKRPYALLVHRSNPDAYVVSLPDIIRAEDVVEGTAARLINPDGSDAKMF